MNKEKTYLFKSKQFLGNPKDFPKQKKGMVSAVTAFIISDLVISEENIEKLKNISRSCGKEVVDSHFHLIKHNNGRSATKVSISFYIKKDLSSELDIDNAYKYGFFHYYA